MLRISDLDYIDYMKNPEKGMQELLKEVGFYIKNKRDEENKREEENERKRILEEKEIEEIELLIKKLQAEELSVEVTRDDLLLRIQRINNDEKRNHLQSLVESTSPGIIKNREKDNSISELKKENQKLKDKLDNMPDVGIMPDKLKKRHIAIVIVLSVLLLSSVIGLIFTSKSISENDKIKILENYKEGNEHDSINNIINGHEYVDLGLPSGLKWATCNVGANKPEECGCYYAWGETKTKEVYDIGTCLTYGKDLRDFSGVERYDAARANWGGSWRMPTQSEFKELVDNCTWTFTSIGGNSGYIVEGPNGNTIFLPAAGFLHGQSKAKNNKGRSGYYWSSTPDDDYLDYYAYRLSFYSTGENVSWDYRSNGLTVRPITE